MSEYIEYLALTNTEKGKYPVIFSINKDEYKFFKKGKNKILLWDPYEEPFVLNSTEKNKRCFLELKKGGNLNPNKLIKILIKSNYTEYDKVYSEKEFAKRGFIIDIFFEESAYPIRIEFFGDTIEEIRIFEPWSQRKIKIKDSLIVYLPSIHRKDFKDEELLKPEDFHFIEEEKIEKKRISLLLKFKNFGEFIDFLKKGKKEIIYVAEDEIRFSYLKKIIPEIKFLKGVITGSFEIEEEKKIIISERDIYPGITRVRKFVLPFREESFFELNPGDTVIYEEEGICSLKGFKKIETNGREIEHIELVFKDNQKLYVPFWEISKIEKYFGKREFTDYSTKKWVNQFVRAKMEIHEFAKKILKLTARRKVMKGISFKLDNEEEEILNEIIASFPYTETEDQKKVWEEVKRDMESEKRMERLIIGDSGFGKTEIALRAASLCALKGYQALFICPTTPLALQHYKNFEERLRLFPLNVKMLSRLLTKKEEKEVLRELKEGRIDILIATHRALSPDVRFKNLGLLIIDEEQRFGVEHKEKIKFLREEIDYLSLSATPIPRTLALSIYGINDISRIRTPPPGRKESEIIIAPYSLQKIKEAIDKELKRNGQVIYVRNRIKPLEEIKKKIETIFPGIKCDILHGRMDKIQIENKLISFILGDTKILITTSILETGMDFENVNTLIIERPDMFGLSELYALKGRVGRRDKKSFVYILLPHKLSEKARERIRIIKRYNFPGSGEKVALKDLELRGPGEIFGKKQKGFIKNFGISMYIKMLEEEIKKLKGEKVLKKDVKIVSYTSLCLPGDMEEEDKIHFTRSLFSAETEEEIEQIIEEYRDRFGKPDRMVKKIFDLARVYLKTKREGKNMIKVFENVIYAEY